MIPDLGKYAVTVMAAYGITLALLGGLTLLSLRRAARIGQALKAAESRRRQREGGI